jgi:hypothetical protein
MPNPLSIIFNEAHLGQWRSLRSKQAYALLLGCGVLFLFSGLLLTVDYVPKFETREGFVPFDPVMSVLPVADMSLYIFFILYAAVFAGFLCLLKDPKMLVTAFYSFAVMYWIRALCITLVPFNEPSGLIVLSDPFIAKLGVYQSFVKRDLFFSGHFASVYLFWVILRGVAYRHLFLTGSVAMGILIMVQRIHYSYDIAGAIVFSNLSVFLAKKLSDTILG